MVMFIVQSAVLLAIAFVLGCVAGAVLERWLGQGRRETVLVSEPSVTVTPDPVSLEESAPVPVKPAPIMPRNSALDPKSGEQRRARPKAVAKSAQKPAKARSTVPQKDDLKRIRGIGRQNEAKLNAQGVESFAAIAAWSKKEQAEWGEKLAFPGRIEREKWAAQAKTLAKGGNTEFSKRVAKGKVASSASQPAKSAQAKPRARRPAQ